MPDCKVIRCMEEVAILAGSPGDKNTTKGDPTHGTIGGDEELAKPTTWDLDDQDNNYFGKTKKQ